MTPTPERDEAYFHAAVLISDEEFRRLCGCEPYPAVPAAVEPPVCRECGKPAVCFGSYEGIEWYACDDCCGHGNEDGWCHAVEPETEGEG